ncbi:MAG: hypothetical protein ABIP56_05715 [Dokdonella sp.]
MSLTATTSLSLAERARQRARMRSARDRFGRAFASVGASVLLLTILAIPLFLVFEWWSAAPLGDGGEQLLVLVWGTLKATLAAVLIAVPFGLGAAIHVAAFVGPRWRGRLRVAMELLESLPTVVIGLVAAIWLAPFLKSHVLALLLALALVSAGIALLARTVGLRERRRWAMLPLLMLPIILIIVVAASYFAPLNGWQPLNPWNAVVVGVAMGLANVPLVFNSAEASLRRIAVSFGTSAQALGAQPLQIIRTMLLPLAWPAMLGSALLAAARCSGETMIVLMASSNTPLLSANPFDGLRSLAADIALSLPVAAPSSAAYSRLLLATLLLFSISFVLELLARRFRVDPQQTENRA